MQICKQLVVQAGYRLSAGFWSRPGYVVAFSVESHGPATYGHPKYTIEGRENNDGTWTFYHENRPISGLVSIRPKDRPSLMDIRNNPTSDITKRINTPLYGQPRSEYKRLFNR
jgi:hypothetical protein